MRSSILCGLIRGYFYNTIHCCYFRSLGILEAWRVFISGLYGLNTKALFLNKNYSFSELFGPSTFSLSDPHSLEEVVANKTILVTGAGGSIGSALCDKIAPLRPHKLILLGRGEHSLYTASRGLTTNYPDLYLEIALADIQDNEQLYHVFTNYKPEIVFHTAAYKHVNMLERFPSQAVLNNVLGTRNVMRVCQDSQVERLAFISTDKAVEPTSVLGATKKLCECILRQHAQNSVTDLVSVRFGNVFRSSGNVVALFEQQAQTDRRITITDPNAKRFYMDVEDATITVLSATKEALNGEVAIMHMDEPVTIGALADELVKSLGLKPNEDVRYDYIGLQPGEKLRERLYTEVEEENMRRVGPMMYTKTDMRGFSYDESVIETLLECARAQDDAKVKTFLASCVPGYTPVGGE